MPRVQTYLLHWCFDDEMRALVQISSLSFLLGFVGFTVSTILEQLFKMSAPGTLPAYRLFDSILSSTLHLVSPHYLAMRTLAELARMGDDQDPWAWSTSGQSLTWLATQAALNCCLVVFVSSGLVDVILWRLHGCASATAVGMLITLLWNLEWQRVLQPKTNV